MPEETHEQMYTHRHEKAKALFVCPPRDKYATSQTSVSSKPGDFGIKRQCLQIHCLIHVLDQASDIASGIQESNRFAKANRCNRVKGEESATNTISCCAKRTLIIRDPYLAQVAQLTKGFDNACSRRTDIHFPICSSRAPSIRLTRVRENC
jgi:hypothetical protein